MIINQCYASCLDDYATLGSVAQARLHSVQAESVVAHQAGGEKLVTAGANNLWNSLIRALRLACQLMDVLALALAYVFTFKNAPTQPRALNPAPCTEASATVVITCAYETSVLFTTMSSVRVGMGGLLTLSCSTIDCAAHTQLHELTSLAWPWS